MHQTVGFAFPAAKPVHPSRKLVGSEVVVSFDAHCGVLPIEKCGCQEFISDFFRHQIRRPGDVFSRQPNAFLVEMTKGRKPGKALDAGMGGAELYLSGKTGLGHDRIRFSR
jgi:hypothetical protein